MTTKPKAAEPKGEIVSTETPQGRARLAMMPEVNAAGIMHVLNCIGEPDLDVLIDRIHKAGDAVTKGDMGDAERMLAAQAHALDSMFSSLARRAKAQDTLPQYEAHMKFALRAQSQCRATLETLATIKNPPNVAFVKQANIAHGPQQVNNGQAVARTEQNANPPTELLEAPHAKPEWMDTRAPRAAASSNPPLEAVGAVHRPANAARQGRREP